MTFRTMLLTAALALAMPMVAGAQDLDALGQEPSAPSVAPAGPGGGLGPGRHHGQGAGRERLLQQIAAHGGRLTRADVMAAREARFNALDTNHDGLVSREEFLAGMQKGGRAGAGEHAGRVFDRLDARGDGQLTLEEFLVPAERMFARLDPAGTGVITADQVRAARHPN